MMIKTTIFTFALFIYTLNLKAQSNTDSKKMILGKWKYNIAYDTIAAVVDTSHFTTTGGK